MSNTTEKTKFDPILPIDPTFLSLSSEYYNINLQANSNELKRSYNPNKHGLFDVNTIRGFLAVMSSDLSMNSQLPLFQIVPNSFNRPESNNITVYNPNEESRYQLFIEGEPLIRKGECVARIDVGKIFPGNPCCTAFKKKYSGKCSEYDSRVLLLFCDRLDKYKSDGGSYSECLKLVCKEYNLKHKFDEEDYSKKVEVRYMYNKNSDSKCFITYICGHSCFREYAFPIFHNGRVIAAIMMGQRIQKKHLNGTADYCPKYRIFNLDAVNTKNFKEFDKNTISLIFERINELELKIDDKIRETVQDAVSLRFHDIESSFRKELSTVYTDKVTAEASTVGEARKTRMTIDGSVEKYKRILDGTLNEICRTIGSEGLIWLYAKKLRIYQPNNNYQIFNLIGKGNSFDSGDVPTLELRFPYGYDFEKDEKDEANKSKAIADKMSIKWKGDSDILHKENDFLDDFSILIREYFSKSFTNKYNEQYTFFRKYLQSFYHTLFEPYNILRAAKLNKNLEISMRITVHEAGNILPTIQQTLYSELKLDIHESEYLNNPQFIPDTRTRSLWDLYQRTLLLRDIYKRSTIAFKDIEVEKDFHDFHRLIYSIKTLFDEKAEADGGQKIIVGMADAYHHVYLYTDSNLFHQILFNLVDNAVKYGYIGSNIFIQISPYISSSFFAERTSSMSISVSSYGAAIQESEKGHIFDLFYRTPDAEKFGVEGMGIGLFLVKKMCESMGYSITVNSECIADHHLPAHYFYNKYNILPENRAGEGINKLLASEISNEQLKSVNREVNWNIGFHEMSSIINMPTHKNTFTITLDKNFDDYLILSKNN